ncbi:hypothetical protein [Streptomyces roseus]|uniref:Uncharacterized protein n=1 Tax=Streptomyces roseus TaxID=66430 RepID=A0A0J6XP94_9ACTN|nr:hypothetical protein [Streptomyces roseus]KMO96072.1 hypothetical protein ACS04_20545 [Streptomyces roseus]
MSARNFHDYADDPAILYVLHHEVQDALKVGIASAAGQELRLQAHRRHGWTTELRIEFETGHQALQVERAVLSFLRSCGATSTVLQAAMPQGGYTETLAHPRLLGLDLQDLLQVTHLASRLVRKAHCSLSRAMRVLFDAVGVLQLLVERGHKDRAREVLCQVLPLQLQLAQAVGRDDIALEVHEFLQAVEAKWTAPA